MGELRIQVREEEREQVSEEENTVECRRENR